MNVVLPDGTSLHGPAEHFEGICKAFWGRKGPTDWRLVFIVNDPAYVLTYPHTDYAGVMPYELVRLPEGAFPKAETAIVYCHPTLSQKTKNVQQWLADGGEPQKFQRLSRLMDFVEKLENSGSEPIFFPYLCGRNIAVQPNGELHLLGAPVDIKRFGDAYIHREILRFIDPNYLTYRNVDPKTLVRPADPALRRRYLRYGLTHIIMETAYGKSVEDQSDLSDEELPATWSEFESIFDSHLNNKNSPIEADAKFFSILKKALSATTGQASPEPQPDSVTRPTPPPVAPVSSTPPTPPPTLTSATTTAPTTAEPAIASARPEPLSWETDSGSLAKATSKYRDDDDYIKDSYNSDDDSLADEATSTPTKRWVSFIPAALLLTLLAMVGGAIWLTGFDLRDPYELKRLRVESMLSRWMQEPEKRDEIAKAIAHASPNNLNLKYLQFLQQLNAGTPAENQQSIKAILTDFDKLSEAQRSSLMFSRNDLQTLESSFTVGTAPPPAQPKN